MKSKTKIPARMCLPRAESPKMFCGAPCGAPQNGGVERKKTPFLSSYKDI